jgi:signal transduction histidine kinase
MVDRLQHAVEDLDDTVRHIRTTIFELQRQRIPGRSVRQEVLDLVSEAAEPAGISHLVRFDGPIDLSVPEAMADQLVAVVREAVTNVVRHAGATQVQIDLAVTDDHLELRVTDDGAGLPEQLRAEGHGLRNLRARAKRLSGEMLVESGPSGGTVLVWRVPLP